MAPQHAVRRFSNEPPGRSQGSWHLSTQCGGSPMSAPLQLLLVDDEPLARSRLRTLLADCAAPAAQVAAEAGNAAQAMEQLRRQPIDAALLDIHMPGADGLALAQALRTLPLPPVVVFVTAYAEHAVTAFELEAVD